TRPLSLPAPMVLGPQGPGRVGRRQAQKKNLKWGSFFVFSFSLSRRLSNARFMVFEVKFH
ncbi:hypothetical protein KQX66_07830, partial [Paenibacillus sp. SM 69]